MKYFHLRAHAELIYLSGAKDVVRWSGRWLPQVKQEELELGTIVYSWSKG